MDIEQNINNIKMGFFSFSALKIEIKKRIEIILNPLFSVRLMILALDKLLPSRACLHPHTDKSRIDKNIFIKKTLTKFNILKVNHIQASTNIQYSTRNIQ